MKIFAVAANAAQWVIILSIFFIRGVDLGIAVILLLFGLMCVPFINLLALFFVDRSKPVPMSPTIEKSGLIKREAMRVSYGEDHCPILDIGGTAFAVRDLSEGGVRISAGSATLFKKKVRGEIQLISGDRVRFKAFVIRRIKGEVALKFVDPIGTALLLQEKKVMAADSTG